MSGSKVADLKSDAIPILLWNNEVPAVEPEPPRWSPSSRECSPLVLKPEPARGSLMWEKTLWKAMAVHRTECDSLFLQSAGPNEIHLAVVLMLLNNLLREPISWDWSLLCLELLTWCPEVENRQENGRTSCLRDPRTGGEALSSAMLTGGQNWEKHLLETAAPWNSGMVGRTISWGRWGEMYAM